MQAAKKLSPLEFSVPENAEGFFVLLASSWSGTLCLSHVCLFCRFVSRDQEGSPAVFLASALCAQHGLLSKEQRFSREVHRGSTRPVWFFFFGIIIKNFCQMLSAREESTHSLKCSRTALKIPTQMKRDALHFFNFLH